MLKKNFHFDYIIVGAGSSGCTLAYRLAKNSAANVLLIEAGGNDTRPLIRMPIGFANLIGEGKHNWNYYSAPEATLDGRSIALPRGKVIGGCNAINGMVYIRGQRQDYDHWSDLGNVGWSFDELLPLFKRTEGHWRSTSPLHGDSGPQRIGSAEKTFSVADAFIDACVASGMSRNHNFNGTSQEGAGYFDTTIDKGIRCSGSKIYRHQSKPKNLTVAPRFLVERVAFNGSRAIGVEGIAKNRIRTSIAARNAVILCAGAFNSPKILEHSGIGDQKILQRHNIPVVVDSPNVGNNLQDHCNSYLFFETQNCETYYDHIRPWTAPITMANYLFRRQGIFANPAAQAGAFFSLDGSSSRPDTQIHFAAAASVTNSDGKLRPISGICASICQLNADSRGDTHIVSNNPQQKPKIRCNYLSTETEQHRQLKAVRKLREIFRQAPLSDMIRQEIAPLGGLQDDAELLAGIKQSLESVHHPAGTCRMGPDADAVVLPNLSVRGAEQLYVADASVMPKLISGNTHAACAVIGEKLADILLDHAQRES